ncbi:hypothetical protein L3V82_02390 [Thiotrichales bacterium 19S3-7]|nr:hypothetical protein [Thiotrichales bacterium 19S3-7]MCF6801016.1 hypothetical protein [Thiotrichales bacterium 19S3-11]
MSLNKYNHESETPISIQLANKIEDIKNGSDLWIWNRNRALELMNAIDNKDIESLSLWAYEELQNDNSINNIIILLDYHINKINNLDPSAEDNENKAILELLLMKAMQIGESNVFSNSDMGDLKNELLNRIETLFNIYDNEALEIFARAKPIKKCVNYGSIFEEPEDVEFLTFDEIRNQYKQIKSERQITFGILVADRELEAFDQKVKAENNGKVPMPLYDRTNTLKLILEFSKNPNPEANPFG